MAAGSESDCALRAPAPVEKLSAATASLISASADLTDLTSLAVQLIRNSLDAACSKVSIHVDLLAWTISCVDDGTGFDKGNLENLAWRCTQPIESLDTLSGMTGSLLPARSSLRYGRRGKALISAAHLGILHIESGCIDNRMVLLQRGHTTLHLGPTRPDHPHHMENLRQPSRKAEHGGTSRRTVVTVRDIFGKLPVRRAAITSSSAQRQSLDSIRRAVQLLSLREPEVGFTVTAEHPQSSLTVPTHVRGHAVLGASSSRELLRVSQAQSIFRRFKGIYGDEIDVPNPLPISSTVSLPATRGSVLLHLSGFISLVFSASPSHRHIFIGNEHVDDKIDLQTFLIQKSLDRVIGIDSASAGARPPPRSSSKDKYPMSEIDTRSVYQLIDTVFAQNNMSAGTERFRYSKSDRNHIYPVYVLDVAVQGGNSSQLSSSSSQWGHTLSSWTIILHLLVDGVSSALRVQGSPRSPESRASKTTDILDIAKDSLDQVKASPLKRQKVQRIAKQPELRQPDELIKVVVDETDPSVPAGMMRWIDEVSRSSHFIDQRTGLAVLERKWLQNHPPGDILTRPAFAHTFPYRKTVRQTDATRRATLSPTSSSDEESDGSAQPTWLRDVLDYRKLFFYRSRDDNAIPRLDRSKALNPSLTQSLRQSQRTETDPETFAPSKWDLTFEPKTPSPQKRAADTRRILSMPLAGSQSRSTYFQVSSDSHEDAKGHSCEYVALDEGTCRLTATGLEQAIVIAQVDRKFVSVNMADGCGGRVLACIDQHAADERIRVETYLKDFISQWAKEGVQNYNLRNAVTVSLTRSESDQLFEEPDADALLIIQKWGFRLVASGDRTDRRQLEQDGYKAEITAVPALLRDRLSLQKEQDLLEEVLREMIAMWRDGTRPPEVVELEDSVSWVAFVRHIPPRLLDLFNSKACRGAIMFNDELDMAQCETLVRKLSQTCFPFHCAHGRPSVAPLCGLGRIGSALCEVTASVHADLRWDGLHSLAEEDD